MNLIINNESHTAKSSSNLLELLAEIHLGEKRGIAVAINHSIVPRADWEKRQLHDNDSITIIHATQGG
jgi:sulfur carrier protein